MRREPNGHIDWHTAIRYLEGLYTKVMEWKSLSMSFLALFVIAVEVSIIFLKCIPKLFPQHSLNYLIVSVTYIGLVSLAMICYFRTMFSDPGSTERALIEDEKLLQRRLERLKEQGLTICESCKSAKPARTHHCSQCARCIYKMDHHCPWVNNCIGACNQKHFVLFLFYITVASIYSLLLSGFALVEMEETSDFALTFLSVCSAVGFGCFTFQLLAEQCYYIYHNTSFIDILQGRGTPNRPLIQNLQEALGRNPLLWFCPTSVSRVESDLTEPLLDTKM